MSCCGFFVGQSILGAPGERKSIPYSRTRFPKCHLQSRIPFSDHSNLCFVTFSFGSASYLFKTPPNHVECGHCSPCA